MRCLHAQQQAEDGNLGSRPHGEASGARLASSAPRRSASRRRRCPPRRGPIPRGASAVNESSRCLLNSRSQDPWQVRILALMEHGPLVHPVTQPLPRWLRHASGRVIRKALRRTRPHDLDGGDLTPQAPTSQNAGHQRPRIEASRAEPRRGSVWSDWGGTSRRATPSLTHGRGASPGGARRIRTADQGFADPCLTTWLWRPIAEAASSLSRCQSCWPRSGTCLPLCEWHKCARNHWSWVGSCQTIGSRSGNMPAHHGGDVVSTQTPSRGID